MALLTGIAAGLSGLGALSGLFGLGKKEPKLPTAEELAGGLSPEMEERFISGLSRRLEKRGAKDIASVRQAAASRGAFRSGQLPILEADVKSDILDRISEARTQIEMDRSQGLASAQRFLAGEKMRRFESGQEAAGGALGTNLQNLLRLSEADGEGNGGLEALLRRLSGKKNLGVAGEIK